MTVTVVGVLFCCYCYFTYSMVLRNYMAQTAIDEAEKGDYSEVKRMLSLLQKPFDDCATAADSDITVSHTPSGEYLSLSFRSCNGKRS